MTVKPTIKAFLYLLAINALFYWKTLFTNQFSLLTGAEGVNQAYSWLAFWVRMIRHGELPLWDSFVYSGRSFLGEMQTAAFDPLHLPFLLLKLDSNGLVSMREYHIFIASIHLLACYFFYLMARELGRSEFASLIAGVLFGLGGMVGELPWPHMLESAIWLPLLFLCLIRGFRTERWRAAVGYGSFAGLSLGLSVLAGGFHLVFMQGIVIVTLGLYRGCANLRRTQRSDGANPRLQIAVVTGLALVIGAAAGAVQLLPSAEYSAWALRWYGAQSSMSNVRIPYLYTDDNRLAPLAFLHLLFPQLPMSPPANGEVWTLYLSIFGLVLVVAGLWKNHSNSWVRYFGWLALAAFLYSLGTISLVNGLAYTFVPKLWMVRESSRFAYLVHFSLCAIAAYGCDTLLFSSERHGVSDRIAKAGRWIVVASLIAEFVASKWIPGNLGPLGGYSVLLICLTFLLLQYIRWGPQGRLAQFFVVCLVMLDLSAFMPQPADLAAARANKSDYLETLRSGSGVASFLNSLPGVFRVDARVDSTPNFGDAFGVRENKGAGVTYVYDYFKILPNFNLLNEKYILLPASATEPNPIYQDQFWKVYANPGAYPRAWLVHQIWTRGDQAQVLGEVAGGGSDLRVGALVPGAIPERLDPVVAPDSDSVTVTEYRNNRLRLAGRAGSRALLVLSENFFPGWHARINGNSAPIYQVDGALRGIVVPAGLWTVDMYYSPATVWLGGILTFLAFVGTVVFAVFSYKDLRPDSIRRNPDRYA